MNTRIHRRTRGLALGAGFALLIAAALAPAAADEQAVQKVKVKKIVRCEGADCTETVEKIEDGSSQGDLGDVEIVTLGDGEKRIEIRKVVCDGEDCPEEEGMHRMVFVGDGGEVEIMKMGDGHHWVHHSGGGGFLGVMLTDLTPELRAHYGAPAGAGVLVAKVAEGSPAEKAGVAVGDVITGAGGEPVGSAAELARRVRGQEDGAALALDLVRGGSSLNLTATVEVRERERIARLAGDGAQRKVKKVVVCDDDEEDCGGRLEGIEGLDSYDCGAETCEVQVECDDGDCTCTVNGEAADCAGIPGVPSR